MNTKVLILSSLAFIVVLTGCLTTSQTTTEQPSERVLYDVRTNEFLTSEGGVTTELDLLFFEEETAETTYSLSIQKYIMEVEIDMYMLTVFDLDYIEDDYEEILIKIDDSVYEILCENISRQDYFDARVLESAIVVLDGELIENITKCESLIIQAGGHFTRIPPEGISKIQEFI